MGVLGFLDVFEMYKMHFFPHLHVGATTLSLVSTLEKRSLQFTSRLESIGEVSNLTTPFIFVHKKPIKMSQ